jgi:type IV secretory pathway VirB4 component
MSSRGSSGLLQDAGACADEIALLRFIDDITFETKLGDLGMILSLTGIDPDCRTDEVLTAFTRRYESAMRLFDDRFRLYSYVVKRSGATPPYRDQYPTEAATSAVHRRAKALEARAGSIYETRLYLAVLYEGFRPRKTLLGSLERATRDVAAEAERALEILGGTVRSFQSLMDDLLATEVLQEREVRLFLRCLVNYDPAHAAAFHMEAGGRLDTTTIDSQVDVYADHLRVNDFFLKSISLKQLPGATAPHLLFDLLSIDSDLIVCAEWKPKSNLHMRRVIRAKQTGFDALFINLAALALHGRGVPKSELPRKHEVEAHYDSLGASMQEIENRGNYFGGFACTVILIGRSLNRVRESVSQVVKVFGRWDASLIDERLNLFPSWLSILPGNYRHSRRYQYLLNVSYADMALIWASYTGDKRNPHLEDEYLCTFETPDRQLFFFNGHVGGVCGIQILGAPESGKSFLTNYLIAQAQKYGPSTMILDIGHSYRDLVAEFGGSFFEISLKNQSATINPFSLPPTADNLEFLFYFVRLLVGKDPQAALDDQAQEDRYIHEALSAIHALHPKDRRLQNLSLPARLYARLRRWCQGGQYGHLFDNVSDTVRFSDMTAFEFQGMERALDALRPLCFYLQQRFDSIVCDPTQLKRLKLLVLDECWRWMLMSEMGPYMVEKLKTGRKHNLGNVFVTQSGLDAERAGYSHLLNEACPMNIFLANPKIQTATYQELFGLNEKQAERIVRQRPRQDVTIFTPQYFKTVALRIDDDQDRLTYSNDPNSNSVKQLRRERKLAGRNLTEGETA